MSFFIDSANENWINIILYNLKKVYWDHKIIEYLNTIIDNETSKTENALELNIIYFKDFDFWFSILDKV